jgi:hypothetical protein
MSSQPGPALPWPYLCESRICFWLIPVRLKEGEDKEEEGDENHYMCEAELGCYQERTNTIDGRSVVTVRIRACLLPRTCCIGFLYVHGV